MSMEKLQALVLELAVTGEGSLEYVQDLITVIENPHAEIERPFSPPWCKCGVCIDMGNDDENKCCGRRVCITSYVMFKKLCLDRDVLKLNIVARCDLRADNMEFSTNAFRKAAYRQMVLWKYGRLGVGNRRIYHHA